MRRVLPATLKTSNKCIFIQSLHNSNNDRRYTEGAYETLSEDINSEYFPDPLVGYRTSISCIANDHPGALIELLNVFLKLGINLTRINSRYQVQNTEVGFSFDIDIPYNDDKIEEAMKALQPYVFHSKITPAIEVDWFPITLEELDGCASLTLNIADLVTDDHPGANDPVYLQRRQQVAENAVQFKFGDIPTIIEYTPAEIECWDIIWHKLEPLLYQHGCEEYVQSMIELQKHCGYGIGKIPQLADVSEYLYEKTGFRLRPTAGLLSSRNFLQGLAFKTFFCTQYLRHNSCPFYTPEPDLVHELIGHVPMFANPEFAQFSQEIGLAAVGATDEQIEQLARCYWFSVEFGLCRENVNSDTRKIYGAGVLSSYGEIEHAMSNKPEIREWDPFSACHQSYPITEFQPIYYLANSFSDATVKMQTFANSFERLYTCRWNDKEEKLIVDRNVKRRERNLKDFGSYVN